MKYDVGDLVLIKDCKYKYLAPYGLRRRFPNFHSKLLNSCGIITQIIDHTSYLEKGETIDNNIYIWFSQLDCIEYFFYENQVTGEIMK
jgi:hypothetical protein